MRVLHINCNYLGTALHQLMIEQLSEIGCENVVFAPTYNKKAAVITPNDNVVVSECFKKWDRLFFDYKQKKIFSSIDKAINISDFDCIHAYTLFTDGNCARKLSKKYNIPYVVAIRNTDVNAFFKLMPHLRGRGIQIMRDASAVFFLSEAYRKVVFEKYVPEKYYDELMAKTRIIPNGIDNFWHENYAEPKISLDKNNLKLVFAGKVDKNKNVPTICEAMKLLKAKGYSASLTVVGKIVDNNVYELIKNDENVTYVSPQPKEELIKIYRANDIFVMPSFTETFGLVYAEAISQSLPVVYSAGQGFDNQFAEGEVGFRADAKSAQSVAEAIEKIVDRYEVITSNIIGKVQGYNWNSICAEYYDIYHKVRKK